MRLLFSQEEGSEKYPFSLWTPGAYKFCLFLNQVDGRLGREVACLGPMQITDAILSAEICLAGISALSKLTMVNADQETCYALSPAQWRANQSNITVLPEKEPRATCYQIWAYEPRMQRSVNAISSGTLCVDPLSLWLSFRNNSDARIELALSDLEKEFRW